MIDTAKTEGNAEGKHEKAIEIAKSRRIDKQPLEKNTTMDSTFY